MIEPKAKAEELVLRYLRLQEEGSVNWFHKTLAKQCAIIAVDEILNNVMMWWEMPIKDLYFATQKNYYSQVRKEIEKL